MIKQTNKPIQFPNVLPYSQIRTWNLQLAGATLGGVVSAQIANITFSTFKPFGIIKVIGSATCKDTTANVYEDDIGWKIALRYVPGNIPWQSIPFTDDVIIPAVGSYTKVLNPLNDLNFGFKGMTYEFDNLIIQTDNTGAGALAAICYATANANFTVANPHSWALNLQIEWFNPADLGQYLF